MPRMSFNELDLAIKKIIENAGRGYATPEKFDTAATTIERLCAENAETLLLHMVPEVGGKPT